MLTGQWHGFCLTQQALADKKQTQRKLGKVGAPEGNKNASHNKEENKGSDSNHCKRGETTDYLLDRIERDFPETYQDIKAGKLGKVGNPTGNNQYTEPERNVDNHKHSKTKGGTDPDYLLDRIERDFPEVYASID